jgi:ferrous iron transport protein B
MSILAAIAGNPNSGKTTLFNSIAGTRYHVGNYSGVTVEKKEAEIDYKGEKINLVDLPGTYSLTAYSMEELVARDFIVNEKPNVIVNIIDASNIERNMYLLIQLLEMGVPVIVGLNMMDVAEKRNIFIDVEKLSKKLGLPVIKLVARTGKGKEELLDAIINYKSLKVKKPNISYGHDLAPVLAEMTELIEKNNFLTDRFPARWIAIKYMENDEQIIDLGSKKAGIHDLLMSKVKKVEEHLQKTLNTYPEGIIADYRYGFISSILKGVVKQQKGDLNRVYLSERIDRVLTNRFVGPVIMFFILFAIYQFTFTFSEYPIDWLSQFFVFLSDKVDALLPNGLLKSLIISGIIDGVGGVLGFTPLIFFMFFVIAILEDSGYMARVAYMLDRVFRFFGLQGSSVVPYIVSGGIAGGCAVPGVMATRTIKGAKERLVTILTAPFLVCGAKIPIFALLVAAFFEGNKASIMLVISLMSWLAALIMAKVLGKTVVKGEASSFVMELPPYRFPTLNGLIIHSWDRTWMYVKKAGTVILAISIILWAMMTFPTLPESKVKVYDQLAKQVKAEYPVNVVKEINNPNSIKSDEAKELQRKLDIIQNKMAEESLKNSIAGKIGSVLEPVTKFAGFDWRTNIALVGGFAAKEVVVSTLGTAYSLGQVDVENSGSLGERLKNDPNWSKATALALIIFTILYAPCIVTVVAITKETGTYKWGLFTVFAYTLLAYFAAVLTYQLFS